MTYQYKGHEVKIEGLGIERTLHIDGARANYSGSDPDSAEEVAKRVIDHREAGKPVHHFTSISTPC